MVWRCEVAGCRTTRKDKIKMHKFRHEKMVCPLQSISSCNCSNKTNVLYLSVASYFENGQSLLTEWNSRTTRMYLRNVFAIYILARTKNLRAILEIERIYCTTRYQIVVSDIDVVLVVIQEHFRSDLFNKLILNKTFQIFQNDRHLIIQKLLKRLLVRK